MTGSQAEPASVARPSRICVLLMPASPAQKYHGQTMVRAIFINRRRAMDGKAHPVIERGMRLFSGDGGSFLPQ